MSDEESKIFLGAAVANGRIRFTSVSQLVLFDPRYEGCNRKWAFRYVFGKKLKRTTALDKGDSFAKSLYNYLTTGVDALPPTLQPIKRFLPHPGPDLECERKFATGRNGEDILKAIRIREAMLDGSIDRAAALSEFQKFAGLTIAGIPVEGAADFRHARGEYVDEDGTLRKEFRGQVVVETGDLKSTTRIHPQIVKSGVNAGSVLPGYAKTAEQVCDHPQMVGYGVYSTRYGGVTHVRLSHVYASKTKKEGAKRTGLLSVEQVLEKWHGRQADVAQKMEQVATALKIEDVEPSPSSCDAYYHVDPDDPAGKRTLKGCGYRYICPMSTMQIAPMMLGNFKEDAMSLFDQSPPPAPMPPSEPSNGATRTPIDPAEYAAAVEAEKARLQAQLATVTPAPLSPAAPPAPPFQGAVGVQPPDAPAADWVSSAEPVPPGEISQITDPELKEKVELHAKLYVERAAAKAAEEAAASPVVSKWCASSTLKVVITTEVAVAGKWICACGKEYSLKTLKPIKEDDRHITVIPKHKPVNKPEESALVKAAEATVASAPQPVLPPPPVPPVSPPPAPQQQLMRYLPPDPPAPPPPPSVQIQQASSPLPPPPPPAPSEVPPPPPPSPSRTGAFDVRSWCREIVEGFGGMNAFEQSEFAVFDVPDRVAAVEWAIRCLANPNCQGSDRVMAAIAEHRARRK